MSNKEGTAKIVKEATGEKRARGKTVCQLLISFFSAAAACMLLLFLTGLIPQSAINQNSAKSAAYFSEKELFPYVIPGQFNTRQDNYADCILINILYHVGTGEESLPVSLVKASYYCEEQQEVNAAFAEAVQEPKEANVDYFRYWHGSMVLLRPLFLFTDIVGARIILAVIGLLFSLVTMAILWKKEQKTLAVVYGISLLLVNSWMTGFCIEYVTTFLLMSIGSFWAVYSDHTGQNRTQRRNAILCYMVITGVMACFLDFLTTETLTITVPLFLNLVLEKKDNEETGSFFFLIKCGAAWGISYGMMFVLKWALAVRVLGTKAMQEALAAAAVRLNGTVYLGESNLDPEASVLQRVMGAIFRNESMLFPYKDTLNPGTGALLFCGLVLFGLAMIYLFRRKDFPARFFGILILLASVPFIRFLFLSNHAYQHYFFTYRALLITVMILLYSIWEYGLRNVIHRGA